MQALNRVAVAALLATTLALAAGGAAAATSYRNASAGAACHAANGALASKLVFNLNYLTNTGTTDMVVMCHLPTDDASGGLEQVIFLRADVVIPVQGKSVTCVAQTGYFGAGANTVATSVARSYTAPGTNASGQVEWPSPELLHRSSTAMLLTLNCKLPPGAKLGLIQHWTAPSPM